MSEILETLKFLGSSWLEVAVAVDKRLETQAARIAELEAALRELIDQTHDCEKELTRKLYRIDFCGESLPLTNARAALEGGKNEC